jgi:hypothetical protein
MSEQKGPTPEEQEEELRMELKLYAFAAVKFIATEIREVTSGEMDCPMCGQRLRFSIAPNNQHMRAICDRQGCINMVE